jgi:hypothetical protein
MSQFDRTCFEKAVEELHLNRPIQDVRLSLLSKYDFGECETNKDIPEYAKDRFVFSTGRQRFVYNNFYELLMWYWIMSQKNVHNWKSLTEGIRTIRKDDYRGYKSKLYFSRIPSYYWTVGAKKGLYITTEGLKTYFSRHSGVPKYFDSNLCESTSTVVNADC